MRQHTYGLGKVCLRSILDRHILSPAPVQSVHDTKAHERKEMAEVAGEVCCACKLTFTPQAFSSLAIFSPAGTEREVRMTREPAVARARTVSTPIPELPPVTTEVLPAAAKHKQGSQCRMSSCLFDDA